MTRYKKSRRNSGKGDRGSALLVTLMVLVGLSLLGLGFVTISETESAISVNERNAAQVRSVAESAAKVVVEWFNNPDWALNEGLMPPNDAAIKQERQALHGGVVQTGYYKPTGLLFDRPHKGMAVNRFFGVDGNSADIVITADTIAASGNGTVQNFLDTFNSRLFFDNVDGGEVTEIRIFAPPVMNATAGNEQTEYPGGSGNFFWNNATRLGVATIEVVAEKRNGAGEIIASATSRAVVAEFPFPGPEGPLQSNSGILTAGAFRVHWGPVIASKGTLALKREMISIPWVNAYEKSHFEYGYDDVGFPVDPGTPGQDAPYLWELVGKNFEDPWFQARSFDDITTDGGSVAVQAYGYTDVDQPENATGVAGWSNQFQFQTENKYPEKKIVPFPFIDYTFWKQIAISGQGQDGIYYLQYVGGTADGGNFRDNTGTTKTFRAWVDTLSGAEEGYYFFDTTDGSNPQLSDETTNTAVLTPEIDLQGGNIFMKGFVYLNALSFGSQGLGGQPGYYNYPGEPYRDVGYHMVDTAGGNVLMYDGGGNPVIDSTKVTNNEWDYQEIDNDGVFDVWVASKTVTREGIDNTPANLTEYFVVPYFDGCSVGVDCSEPHEPYLNLKYPDTGTDAACCSGAGQPTELTVGWFPMATQDRQPKEFLSDNTTPITCSSTSTIEQCSSNAWDEEGPLIRLDSNAGKGPILQGVLYNEGKYSSTGNAIMYGSVLMRGFAEKAGTVDVFFDESLVRGDWQDQFTGLPRVIMTSLSTDF